jgi:hypothetical protein
MPQDGSWVNALTLDLPAGSWMLIGKGYLGSPGSRVTCDLFGAGETFDRTLAQGGPHVVPFALTTTVSLPSPTT